MYSSSASRVGVPVCTCSPNKVDDAITWRSSCMCALRSEPSVHIIRVVSAQIIHFSDASSNDSRWKLETFTCALARQVNAKRRLPLSPSGILALVLALALA